MSTTSSMATSILPSEAGGSRMLSQAEKDLDQTDFLMHRLGPQEILWDFAWLHQPTTTKGVGPNSSLVLQGPIQSIWSTVRCYPLSFAPAASGHWRPLAWIQDQSRVHFLECLNAPGIRDEGTRSEIGTLLGVLEQFPVSYNQALLSGSLAYCRRALQRGASKDPALNRLITKYVSQVKNTVMPYFGDVPAGWNKLDFTLYSDRFENIQQLCAERSILPMLQDLTIEDVAED